MAPSALSKLSELSVLSEQACRAGIIDLELVSRRMFFDWLRLELQPRRLAA